VGWISVGVLSIHGVRPVLLSPVSFSWSVISFSLLLSICACPREERSQVLILLDTWVGVRGGRGGVVLILYPVFGFVSFLCLGAVISLTISSGSSDATFCLSSPLYSVYFSTSSLSSLLWRSLHMSVCVEGGGARFFFCFFSVPSLSLYY